MITVGTHLAKISDYAINTTAKGDPQILIAFNVGADRITWRGSLKEGKAREITFKTLLTCGWSGKTVSDLADGPASGALDVKKELNIVIDDEPGQDGKIYKKVSWINEPNSGLFKERLAKTDAVQKLQGMNIEAAFNFYKAESNYKAPEKKAEAPVVDNDSLPF